MSLRSILLNSTLVTVAVIYGLLLAIADSAGLFGIWLLVLLLLSTWRFGYAVLRAVAQGRTPQTPSIETMNPLGEFPLVLHWLIFPGVFLWYQVVVALSPDRSLGLLGLAVGVPLIAIFPASAGLLALTGNLPYALNPRRIQGFIREAGTRYLFLLVGCIAVVVGANLAGQMLSGSFLLGGLWLTCTIYVWAFLALFALIGATIFASREVFDIPGLAEDKNKRQARWDLEDKFSEWQRVLDTVYANWRADQHSEAFAELRKLIDREGNSVEIFAWLFEQTLEWADKRCAVDIGRRYVQRLLEEADEPQALAVALRCRRYSDPLSLAPGDATRLAEYARNNGQLGLADELASWE